MLTAESLSNELAARIPRAFHRRGFCGLPRRRFYGRCFVGGALGEMFAHFGGKLAICHFISCLQFYDATTMLLALEALNELPFGFSWANDQNRFDTTNASDYFVVEILKPAHELSLQRVLRYEVIRCVLVI